MHVFSARQPPRRGGRVVPQRVVPHCGDEILLVHVDAPPKTGAMGAFAQLPDKLPCWPAAAAVAAAVTATCWASSAAKITGDRWCACIRVGPVQYSPTVEVEVEVSLTYVYVSMRVPSIRG